MSQAARQPVYDVFLSFSSPDERIVRVVNDALRAKKVSVFFAKEAIEAGASWQRALQDALSTSATFVYFIGALAHPWAKQELEAIQVLKAENPGIRLIPVLLPGSSPDDIPLFLRTYNWVDCRSLVGDADELVLSPALQDLVAAILGTRPSQPKEPEPLSPFEAWVSRHLPLLRLVGLVAASILGSLCAHEIVLPFVPLGEAAWLTFTNYWVVVPLIAIVLAASFIWRLDPNGRSLRGRLLADIADLLRGRRAVYVLAVVVLVLGFTYALIPPFVQVHAATGPIPDLRRLYTCASRVSQAHDPFLRVQGGAGRRAGCDVNGLERTRFDAVFNAGWYRPDVTLLELEIPKQFPQVEVVDLAVKTALNVTPVKDARCSEPDGGRAPSSILDFDGDYTKVALQVAQSALPRSFSIHFASQYSVYGRIDTGEHIPFVVTIRVKAGSHGCRERSFPLEAAW